MCYNKNEYTYMDALCVYTYVYVQWQTSLKFMFFRFSFFVFLFLLFIGLDCVYSTAELLLKYLLSSYAPINN